jgi:hypothetical protein
MLLDNENIKFEVLSGEKTVVKTMFNERESKFEKFDSEITVGCLILRHHKSFELEQENLEESEYISCEAILESSCLGIGTIERITEESDESYFNLMDLVANKQEQSRNRINTSQDFEVNETFNRNEAIHVTINPAKDDKAQTATGALWYHDWIVSSLTGSGSDQVDAKLILDLPKPIFNELKNNIYEKSAARLVLRIKPTEIALRDDTAVERATRNGLFCQKLDDHYLLSFFDEASFQSIEVTSLSYCTDATELKDSSIIREFGYWKDKDKNIPNLHNISSKLDEIKNELETTRAANKLIEKYLKKLADKKIFGWF